MDQFAFSWKEGPRTYFRDQRHDCLVSNTDVWAKVLTLQAWEQSSPGTASPPILSLFLLAGIIHHRVFPVF